MHILALVLCFVSIALCSPAPPYKTYYFTQPIDHFNQELKETYKQRYLVADAFWGTKTYPKGCKGPIFFYTGNESPVTDYYSGSGLFTQILAPKYGGLLVFAEHRYFGESLPFGNESFARGNIGYLSVDQALADYAVLITNLKNTIEGASNCPVILFGGSYGGMLTTWFRIKYPQLSLGGLAASAPFAFAGTDVTPFAFADACTKTYEEALGGCEINIFTALTTLITNTKTPEGRLTIQKTMKLCNPLPTEEAALEVYTWAMEGLALQAELDYPYATDYGGVQLPAWPVNVTCNRISKYDFPFDGLGDGLGTIYNTTGDKTCYDPINDVPGIFKNVAWPYLACTEVYLPHGYRGMFPLTPWNASLDVDNCMKLYGVTLVPEWPLIQFGGFDVLKSTSHIIFSNGMLDPLHTQGVLEDLSPTLISIMIPEAGHHLDLRGPNPNDPIYVTEARIQEDKIIGSWIQEYFSE